jgi:hypothetical protein
MYAGRMRDRRMGWEVESLDPMEERRSPPPVLYFTPPAPRPRSSLSAPPRREQLYVDFPPHLPHLPPSPPILTHTHPPTPTPTPTHLSPPHRPRT